MCWRQEWSQPRSVPRARQGKRKRGGILTISGAVANGMAATVSGGSASFGSDNGADFQLTGQHGALAVTLGSGSFVVTRRRRQR